MENRAFGNLFKEDRNVFLDRIQKSSPEYPGAQLYLHKNDKPRETVYKIQGMRWKFQQYEYGPEIDETKSQRALPANIIQAADAKFAHFIIKKVPCLPIHDSFIVDVEDCHILMDEANNYFRSELGGRGRYSMFILL